MQQGIFYVLTVPVLLSPSVYEMIQSLIYISLCISQTKIRCKYLYTEKTVQSSDVQFPVCLKGGSRRSPKSV